MGLFFKIAFHFFSDHNCHAKSSQGKSKNKINVKTSVPKTVSHKSTTKNDKISATQPVSKSVPPTTTDEQSPQTSEKGKNHQETTDTVSNCSTSKSEKMSDASDTPEGKKRRLLEKAPLVNFGPDIEHWEDPSQIKPAAKVRYKYCEVRSLLPVCPMDTFLVFE